MSLEVLMPLEPLALHWKYGNISSISKYLYVYSIYAEQGPIGVTNRVSQEFLSLTLIVCPLTDALTPGISHPGYPVYTLLQYYNAF
jgi:hypothetical protein